MIAGLVQILLFQGLGEIVARFFLPLIPGPVIGLVLLVAWLRFAGACRNRSTWSPRPSARTWGSSSSRRRWAWSCSGRTSARMRWRVAALVVSVVATMAVTALVLRAIAKEGPE